MNKTAQLTCLSSNCPERFSLCCSATSRKAKAPKRGFICADCGDKFYGGDCEAYRSMDLLSSDVLAFLFESNAIEDVHDADSLVQAIYAWEYLAKQNELNIGVINKTHKILMLHQNLRPNEKGYLRTAPVWIGGHEAMKYYAIPSAFENWCLDVNEFLKNKLSDPNDMEEQIKRFHVRYEAIHPHIDGNGRLGRMLWQKIRINSYLPVKVIFNSDKYEYYKWFS